MAEYPYIKIETTVKITRHIPYNKDYYLEETPVEAAANEETLDIADRVEQFVEAMTVLEPSDTFETKASVVILSEPHPQVYEDREYPEN